MLKIHHTHHYLSNPRSLQSGRPMTLSGPLRENDELIQAIEREHEGEIWTLAKEPDVNGLETFWNKVQDDIAHDPTWFQFTNE